MAALLLGTALVWALERRTHLPTETMVGVIFSAALAVGSMLTSGEELIEALFGTPGAVSPAEATVGVLAAALVITFIWRAKHRLVLALVSPDMARTAGVPVSALNLQYLFAFALTIALGLRYLGVLLMGSLIIIPAATAKHLAPSLNAMLTIAVALAVVATMLGMYGAPRLHVASGPLTVAIAAGVFLVSLLKR